MTDTVLMIIAGFFVIVLVAILVLLAKLIAEPIDTRLISEKQLTYIVKVNPSTGEAKIKKHKGTIEYWDNLK